MRPTRKSLIQSSFPKMVCPKALPQLPSLVQDNADFLRALARTKSHNKRRRLLRHAGAAQLLSLVEICLNILCETLPLTKCQHRRLKPHATFLRRLSRSRTEHGARRLLVQQGSGVPGLFAALLTPILELLAQSLASNAAG